MDGESLPRVRRREGAVRVLEEALTAVEAANGQGWRWKRRISPCKEERDEEEVEEEWWMGSADAAWGTPEESLLTSGGSESA